MLPDKYKIKRSDDGDLTPEETLADALSAHATVEMPISGIVFTVVFIGIGLVFALFLARAFSLQYARGQHYADIVLQSTSSRYSVPSTRGAIFDTQGKPLVENVPTFDLVIVRAEFFRDRTASSSQIETMVGILGKTDIDIRSVIDRNASNGVFVLAPDISKEQALALQTAAIPGVYAVSYAQRRYPLGVAAAHVVGYTAKISPDELKNNEFYRLSDRVGRIGLEAQYEEVLRGTHRAFELHDGANQSDQTSSTADNIVTSLDRDIQQHLYDAMVETFRSSGVTRGAAIVENVRTGEVLGMVSLPAFDPNIFENSGDESSSRQINALLTNALRPLFNRVIGGLYSPGSTIKPLLALAGLQEKIVTPSTTILANGSIQVYSEANPSVVYTFRDWKVHGLTDIRKAIAWSVDVYFYALGGGYQDIRGLGIDRIAQYFGMFRADKKTGIDLPGEAQGFIPTKQWKKDTKGESWFVGDTYNVSIGQGDLQVTPIWLTAYVSAIANGGSIMKPFLVKEIQNPDGTIKETFKPTTVAKLPLDPQVLQVVREGMRQTITDGTAQILQDLPVQVAAKTGTAQVAGKSLNSLFVVYGPYENPDIAMTVLVEQIPQSQSIAMHVANSFLAWYFTKPQAQ